MSLSYTIDAKRRLIIVRAGGVTCLGAHRLDIRLAPALGADTDAVLEEAGIDAAERVRLRARHVL